MPAQSMFIQGGTGPDPATRHSARGPEPVPRQWTRLNICCPRGRGDSSLPGSTIRHRRRKYDRVLVPARISSRILDTSLDPDDAPRNLRGDPIDELCRSTPGFVARCVGHVNRPSSTGRGAQHRVRGTTGSDSTGCSQEFHTRALTGVQRSEASLVRFCHDIRRGCGTSCATDLPNRE